MPSHHLAICVSRTDILKALLATLLMIETVQFEGLTSLF